VIAARKALAAHLASGATTVCRAWAVTRADGWERGFTDHDEPFAFEGITFAANAGLSASALQQTTGLAVDNTEAVGALSSAALSEAEILGGRFDGAKVRAWLVNWADPAQRIALFSGEFGELKRGGGAFQAELRGLSEALNQPGGLVYHKACSAVLGDGRCRFDLDTPGYAAQLDVEVVQEARVFQFTTLTSFDQRWFEAGRVEVLSGAAKGLVGVIKNDRIGTGGRTIELWQSLRGEVAAGDRIRLQAGCDKRSKTCRLKFHNFSNFRGFPQMPGEDWLMAYPRSSGANDGGRLR